MTLLSPQEIRLCSAGVAFVKMHFDYEISNPQLFPVCPTDVDDPLKKFGGWSSPTREFGRRAVSIGFEEDEWALASRLLSLATGKENQELPSSDVPLIVEFSPQEIEVLALQV